ncbi:silent information regulator family protein [Naegleria gruberi]|uniref:protein acetyllysine N-acetyltransferase n=1 Tax=Naegleria gruberi TaxID=5762 RepID=D2VZT9_NAEGR|nr:silent information regulator family protein [Naegleria gruberi]EFC37587.1 silent information regulator family protein [Naegleria gruberi]|eukprot:XP_002670331.1 silent information regulator family protein [Naegleria gruberi strain NEG-M]
MTKNNSSEDITEYYDDPTILNEKLDELAQLLQSSKHVVFYTGAGISTSAGISDFRGPNGIWTMKEKGMKAKASSSTIKLPTPTHMAIATLYQRGMIKYVTSQNVDGLHVKSGFSRKDISELHGNTNVELCKNCNCEYLRTFRCRNAEHVHDHKTGRMCEHCGHELEDSIINFGENLPEDQLDRAELNAKKADLAIVLGTSLRVSPACDLPEMCLKKGGKMVIVNLQKTPKDKKSSLRIFAKTDDVINGIMERLSLSIPSYVLKSEFTLGATEKEEKSIFGNIRRKIGVSLTSPIKGARILSELEMRLVCEKKILKYTTPTIDEIPQDCKKVVARLSFNLDPKFGKEAECELVLDNPHSSKTFFINVDTSDNSVQVTEAL